MNVIYLLTDHPEAVTYWIALIMCALPIVGVPLVLLIDSAKELRRSL